MKENNQFELEPEEKLFSIDQGLEDRRLIKRYKESDCDYCNGASIDGCNFCSLGKKVRSRYQNSEKEVWDVIWGY